MKYNKKTAIVSCYFQPNYGSMLQALATQMALDKLNYDNETINIDGFNREIKRAKIKYFMKAAVTSDILLSKIGMFKNLIRKSLIKNDYTKNIDIRMQAFLKFKKKYFKLSDIYNSKKELGEKCVETYSSVLVGSDQLWLPGNIAADYYTLNFVPESVNTIAYATSFGQASLPSNSSKLASVFLKKIRHIGVREESGKKIVEKLSGRKVPIVCDPTLLFSGDDWMTIQEKSQIVNGEYIFCYFLGNNALHRDFAIRLKEKTGIKIVALTHLDEYVKCDEKYADITPYDVGPAEFLNLIRCATYVCTDSFHCSAYSIQYQKKFFSFRRFARKTKMSTNSRLDTLFMLTGIEGRILNGDEDISSCLAMEIDYETVHKKLGILREESFLYLKNALEDKESTDCD